MKIRYKEDPKEWRKSVWLTTLGLTMVTLALVWRRVVPLEAWLVGVGILTALTALAFVQPAWFRGYYRVSLRVGTVLSYWLARVILVAIFLLVVTPLGLLLRMAGKDLLGLKHKDHRSYWTDARDAGPLDRLF